MTEIIMPKPSQLITNTIQATEYNLYLHGVIGEPDDFMEHFAVLKQAGENDVVRLYITSEGGSLATGMEYIRHMRECAAPIIGVLGLEVSSMASAIALECDSIEVDDMSTMLIHSMHYGVAGTESSIYNQAQFNNRLNERWIKKHYSFFLTESQLNDVFKGVDILLDADEIVEAWDRLQEHRKEEQEGDLDGEVQGFDLASMIEEAVAKAVENLHKNFDITPKPKPQRRKKAVDNDSGVE